MPVFKHTAHVEMWDWLAKNPKKEKHNWPGWKINGGTHDPVIGQCFACGYAKALYDNRPRFAAPGRICENRCPLIWPKNNYGERECCFGGLFAKWAGSGECPEARIMMAEQIRDLPLIEGFEGEDAWLRKE